MAGLMDDMKDKMGDTGNMRERYDELRSKESTGDLDDKGRQELQQLRDHFSSSNE
jgi:hypothetical protein